MPGQLTVLLHLSYLSAACQAVHFGHLAIHEDDGEWNAVCGAELCLFEVPKGPNAVVGCVYNASGFCELFAEHFLVYEVVFDDEDMEAGVLSRVSRVFGFFQFLSIFRRLGYL